MSEASSTGASVFGPAQQETNRRGCGSKQLASSDEVVSEQKRATFRICLRRLSLSAVLYRKVVDCLDSGTPVDGSWVSDHTRSLTLTGVQK